MDVRVRVSGPIGVIWVPITVSVVVRVSVIIGVIVGVIWIAPSHVAPHLRPSGTAPDQPHPQRGRGQICCYAFDVVLLIWHPFPSRPTANERQSRPKHPFMKIVPRIPIYRANLRRLPSKHAMSLSPPFHWHRHPGRPRVSPRPQARHTTPRAIVA